MRLDVRKSGPVTAVTCLQSDELIETNLIAD
jgi:hypothetical protein